MGANGVFLRRLGTLIFTLALAGMVYGGWRVLTSLSSLNFRHIVVTGQTTHVSRAMAEAAVFSSLTGNFFGQRLENVQAAFEKLPWVKRVSVRRVWPDTLEIDITEHGLFARWGSAALMDSDGSLFQGATDQALPTLFGPENTQLEVKKRYEDFLPILASAKAKIKALELDNRYAWTITLATGEKIHLGREDRPGALKQRVVDFAGVYPRLMDRYGQRLATVNMAYANGFAVTVKPGPVHQVATTEKQDNDDEAQG